MLILVVASVLAVMLAAAPAFAMHGADDGPGHENHHHGKHHHGKHHH
jgi:Spy/CpxP family protein refolding chaperone